MDLNIAEMCRMYSYHEKCESENMKAVSAAIFREILNNDFNLNFKKPHSDTCKSCDFFKTLLSNLALPAGEREEI